MEPQLGFLELKSKLLVRLQNFQRFFFFFVGNHLIVFFDRCKHFLSVSSMLFSVSSLARNQPQKSGDSPQSLWVSDFPHHVLPILLPGVMDFVPSFATPHPQLRNETLMLVAAQKFRTYEKLAEAGLDCCCNELAEKETGNCSKHSMDARPNGKDVVSYPFVLIISNNKKKHILSHTWMPLLSVIYQRFIHVCHDLTVKMYFRWLAFRWKWVAGGHRLLPRPGPQGNFVSIQTSKLQDDFSSILLLVFHITSL